MLVFRTAKPQGASMAIEEFLTRQREMYAGGVSRQSRLARCRTESAND
jgi:hypothetical protein